MAAAMLADPEFKHKVRAARNEQISNLAHAAGLTEEDDYAGWLALAVIAYAVLYPPLKAAYHIEQQVAGVLDQLYNWLGGVGKAVDHGVKSIEQGVSYVLSGRWI